MDRMGDACAADAPRPRLDRLDPRAVTPADRARAARLREGIATEVRTVAALTPPRGDEAPVERWLAQRRQDLAALDRLVRALRRGEARAIDRSRAEFSDGDLRAAELARAYGVARCADR